VLILNRWAILLTRRVRQLRAGIGAKPFSIVKFRTGALPGTAGHHRLGPGQRHTRLSNEERLALDVWYVDHVSLRLDTRILFLTALTLISGEKRNDKHLKEARRHLAERYGASTLEPWKQTVDEHAR